MNIIKRTSTHNTSSRPNRTIKYIVIHYTAGVSSKGGSAANIASYFASQGSRSASADFIVDDRDIIQYNPDIKNRNCWHCGGSKQGSGGATFYGKCTNSNSIGIEVCSTNRTGKVTNANDPNWSYTDASLKNAMELTKYLMKQYNVPASNVIRHYDVTGKACPGIIGWNGYTKDETKWQQFKAQISGETAPKSTDPNGKANGYKVKVTANSLNVRRKPSASADIVTILSYGEVYTIVGIDRNWGQLKSGLGWINLNYTEVVK